MEDTRPIVLLAGDDALHRAAELIERGPFADSSDVKVRPRGDRSPSQPR